LGCMVTSGIERHRKGVKREAGSRQVTEMSVVAGASGLGVGSCVQWVCQSSISLPPFSCRLSDRTICELRRAHNLPFVAHHHAFQCVLPARQHAANGQILRPVGRPRVFEHAATNVLAAEPTEAISASAAQGATGAHRMSGLVA
jgi:hypothetical protein